MPPITYFIMVKLMSHEFHLSAKKSGEEETCLRENKSKYGNAGPDAALRKPLTLVNGNVTVVTTWTLAQQLQALRPPPTSYKVI